MSKEQIEEMKNDICARTDYCYGACGECNIGSLAKQLYNADYRKQEWISVDERLPNEDGWYITYTNANGKNEGVIAQRLVTATVRGKKTRRWEWQTRVSPWIVTHWMPLPEPPKMEGGAE